jgi:heat-inducible transcriptional repressor
MGTLAFTTLPQSAPAPVKSVELLRLQEMLLVVILVLQEASVYKQIIRIDSSLSNSEIEHARNRLNEAIVGVPVHSLPDRVSHVNTGLERLAFDSALTALKRHNNGSRTENRFSGISKLFRQPEMIANPVMAEGATWIIEDPSAISTLDESTDTHGTASVVIGEENTEEALKNFSVVFSRYGTSNTAEGIIGVMAPTRMRYGTAIPSVRYIARQLNEITTMVYG